MTLNKEKVVKLTSYPSLQIRRGLKKQSTEHYFTCDWCTGGGGGEDPKDSYDTCAK